MAQQYQKVNNYKPEQFFIFKVIPKACTAFNIFGALFIGTVFIVYYFYSYRLVGFCNHSDRLAILQGSSLQNSSILIASTSPVHRNRSSSITNRALYTIRKIDPPAVLLEVKGGIGNQLFQYACHYAIARKNNWPLYIYAPESERTNSRQFDFYQREFVLDYFNIPLYHWNTIDDSWNITNPVHINDSAMLSNQYPTDSVIRQSGGDYCQSETFFLPYKEEILELFEMKKYPIANLIDMEAESVAVHIRRGDFLHLNTSVSYKFFLEAMESIVNIVEGKPKFYIFSDDIRTVEKELFPPDSSFPFGYEVNFVGGPGKTTSLQDFFLMLKCKHLIISNSTFSWWAAYLNKNVYKIIIAANVDITLYKRIYSEVLHQNYFMMSYGHLYYPYDWTVLDAEYVGAKV